ncbi:MAG: hypothetical protein MZV63_58305 [Marinilabiliales bacterium]|nr:hypothetical protein [Marinilabiliales bacterium]
MPTADPGRFETRENQFGKRVLAIEKEHLFLIGNGFTPEGQFPFIDEFRFEKRVKRKGYINLPLPVKRKTSIPSLILAGGLP